MQYQDIPGQEKIKSYLSGAVISHTLPHALLFLGECGTGLLPMALATAQYLMCENRFEDHSCGQCANCHKASKAIHPDIHFSFPTVGSKVTSLDLIKDWRAFLQEKPYGDAQDWLSQIGGENKQGNINKDECHRILKALSLKTFEGNYKVHLLWMAEYLGKEGNRLLKIIEEPPPNTVFIFMASDQDEILNTILSRCQLVTFSAIADDTLVSYLMKVAPARSEAECRQIAYLANGNIGQALTHLDSDTDSATGQWLEWMRVCFRGDPISMVQWSDSFAKLDREAQKRFLGYGLHFIREMLINKVDDAQPTRLLESEKAAMVKLKSMVPLDRLESMIVLVTESIFHLERNANGRILMLDNCIKMNGFLKPKNQLMAS